MRERRRPFSHQPLLRLNLNPAAVLSPRNHGAIFLCFERNHKHLPSSPANKTSTATQLSSPRIAGVKLHFHLPLHINALKVFCDSTLHLIAALHIHLPLIIRPRLFLCSPVIPPLIFTCVLRFCEMTNPSGSVVQLGVVNEKDYREDPQDYNHGIPPLKRSEPNIPVDVLLEATKPIQPFPWDSETDLKVDG
ncbi:unnamed protein product [Vicia faba]|uniref:Uncharacterized protein n=1 Tax=Vicia faba TaxID=3906 RepID=A0AAV1B4Z2_VICFA|nr:unnamed protein product [Vicia faba]